MITAMEMATAERTDLAEFLSTLTPDEWHHASLCAGWSVKDVVAHMFSYEDLGPVGLAKRFASGAFVHANQVGVEKFRPMSTAELLQRVNDHLEPTGLTAGLGGMIALTDGTIHHQDIRRALGKPRRIPAERLRKVISAVPTNPRLSAWRNLRGLRVTATDLDWSRGSGPEVSGPAEAVLMAITGRANALADLSGDGVAILAKRVAR